MRLAHPVFVPQRDSPRHVPLHFRHPYGGLATAIHYNESQARRILGDIEYESMPYLAKFYSINFPIGGSKEWLFYKYRDRSVIMMMVDYTK